MVVVGACLSSVEGTGAGLVAREVAREPFPKPNKRWRRARAPPFACLGEVSGEMMGESEGGEAAFGEGDGDARSCRPPDASRVL